MYALTHEADNNSAVFDEGSRYLMHTYSRLPVVFTRAKMQYLWDANGKKYVCVSDQLNKTVVGKTDDDRYYFEVTFSASESNLSTIVSCKMIPSALYIIGVLLPCIASIIITIILIIVILIIRKKRKIKKPKKISKEEDITSYEEEDFYVPPPPGSK